MFVYIYIYIYMYLSMLFRKDVVELKMMGKGKVGILIRSLFILSFLSLLDRASPL